MARPKNQRVGERRVQYASGGNSGWCERSAEEHSRRERCSLEGVIGVTRSRLLRCVSVTSSHKVSSNYLQGLQQMQQTTPSRSIKLELQPAISRSRTWFQKEGRMSTRRSEVTLDA